jgi:hypothetical protein
MPAQAGIQLHPGLENNNLWIPASAGMTMVE